MVIVAGLHCHGHHCWIAPSRSSLLNVIAMVISTMNTWLFLIALPIACALPSLKIGRTQSAAVKGVLMCNGKPAVGVKVKLYDDDRGVDLDDLMDEGITDAQGRFELRGHETEITNIDPKLNVYHDCNDENIPCLKKFSIMIPDSFITEGDKPKKVFDAGTLNLAGKFSGESRDCLN
ncbi:Transthyretin-like protein 5 [Toxocara canis]|uniref:Transthyretin-like protein 5 n=1 Tax=Toxocara canis TaxID=6265 RepID=A0A0B2W5C6_TOXCA|nr:Transthyretin-like protein 5 [Toxocara canis]